MIAAVGAACMPLVAYAGTVIENPTSVNSISDFIIRILQAMVRLGLVVVAFFILLAGFMYISARGNTSKLNEAHENFKYVIYGAVLILGAWVIATIIGGTVTQVLGS
jgi:hypothetical protein